MSLTLNAIPDTSASDSIMLFSVTNALIACIRDSGFVEVAMQRLCKGKPPPTCVPSGSTGADSLSRQRRHSSLKPLVRTFSSISNRLSVATSHGPAPAVGLSTLSKSPSQGSTPSSSSPTPEASPLPHVSTSQPSQPPTSAQQIRLMHSISTRFISFALGLTGLLFNYLLPEPDPGVTHARVLRKLVALLAVSAGSVFGMIGALCIVKWKSRGQGNELAERTGGMRTVLLMHLGMWDAPSPGMVLGVLVINSAIGYMVNV
ncbi:hypothetical protein BCR44DRAFT_1443050 [Catenaria anguillulae PL171]|uniref:Uncharacterized protein n=1 Tax=Catenaria anguillulae PL171 TaxID=765915 RepID=A0A1Y2H983_9FUNG|nr:hypothetical protein BCR44DRAFT_1443050 [Catenaria anguillulae PL171]